VLLSPLAQQCFCFFKTPRFYKNFLLFATYGGTTNKETPLLAESYYRHSRNNLCACILGLLVFKSLLVFHNDGGNNVIEPTPPLAERCCRHSRSATSFAYLSNSLVLRQFVKTQAFYSLQSTQDSGTS
jgi:hypothetical protein